MPRRKLTADAMQTEMYRNVVNITETLVHFKDILKSLIDMGMKTTTDIQVMNAKWVAIKDKMDDMSKCIDTIEKSTTTMLAQLDLKEKERFVAKIEAKNKTQEKVQEKKKFQWADIRSFINKNPWPTIIIVVLIVGTILTMMHIISPVQFWNGITGQNIVRPD